MGCVNTKDVQKVEQIKVEELTKDELESLSRNSGVNVKMLKLYADFLYKNRIHLIGCINQYSTYGSVFTIYDETIQQLAILKIYEDSTLSSVYKNSYQYIQQRNILKIYNFIQSQRLKATFLVVELCSGTLETLISERRNDQDPFSKIEVYYMAQQLINGLINSADKLFDFPEISTQNILIDRQGYSLKLVQAHIHSQVFGSPFALSSLSNANTAVLIPNIVDHKVHAKCQQNLSQQAQNLGLVLLNLTNVKEFFNDLKLISKIQLENVQSHNFNEFNQKVIRRLINCDKNSQIEFLLEIKNILNELLQDEKLKTGKDNFFNILKINQPYMVLKEKNEKDRKVFNSFNEFLIFHDKDYLPSIEIRFDQQMIETDFGQLVQELRLCENLCFLKLFFRKSNRFNTEQIGKLTSSLQQASNLQSLEIEFLSSQISSAGIESLFEQLHKIKTIKTLSLKFKESLITEKQAQNIQNHLQNYNQLKHLELDFSNCSLKEKSLKVITEGVFQNSCIKSFKFNLNQIHTTDFEIFRDFGNSLQTATQIEIFDLDLQQNHLDSETLKCIVNGLSEIKSLKKLSLNISNNSFFSDGLLYLTENLSKLDQLQTLHLRLHQVGLKSSICRQFTQNFKLYPKLSNLSLRLQYNYIDDEGAEEMVKQMSNQNTIKVLLIDFSNNKTHQKDKERSLKLRLLKMKRLISQQIIYSF
ncbi:hypothetical protein TTHERM_00429840 (macronuclear) [Tetrahymena thermophila SB210]|uniref:Protein kinase domain-containing protein n=1 Tax=Tetrahymena thermophila (strain SB210) TaxID=312017 RepID=Q231H6_TETTS|nr:hypothetical protein TTHERM_00429840 [Tetrahymena thermophila SB210]EAR91063.3 hypothetical protein TTHERM_00429840 [Tetrahymena thermophila SB210]|eukprot:XP_001011308.3 hypothetical protein TTHERM_00429840 [Tetrahymena thermophila SB210]